MVRCLPRFLAIQRWRRSRRFACSQKAGRHEFSAERLDPNRSSLRSLRCEISAENGLTISHAESPARMWWYKPTEGRPVTKLAGAESLAALIMKAYRAVWPRVFCPPSLLVDAAGQKTSVDDQSLPGHEGSGIGAEVDRGSDELFGLTEAAHRCS